MSQSDPQTDRRETSGPDRAAGAVPSPAAATRPPAGSSSVGSRWAVPLAACLIVTATLAAYANSFQGVFVFDDQTSIIDNPTIRHLWPIWRALSPPSHGETVTGRPLLNLTFALNYAVGRLNPWGYHAVNLAIHILAALTLFGILRRTLAVWDMGRGVRGEETHDLARSTPDSPHPAPRTFLAFAVALLWALHPLQTESVTYIAQRAESLCGLFYLLTLYCAIRGATLVAWRDEELPDAVVPASHFRAPFSTFLWYAAAVQACVLGMATKEVMITVPLVVLLYDRTFLAGSFLVALRRRWALYSGLALTWAVVVSLVLFTGLSPRSAGFAATESMPGWDYLRSQAVVIPHYLSLCIWPASLCLDYGRTPLCTNAYALVLGAAAIIALLAATVVGFATRRDLAMLGAWLLVVLAPTSLLPLPDVAFEHRMYVPSVAVIAALVFGGNLVLSRVLPIFRVPETRRATIATAVFVSAAVALGVRTWLRNVDYRTDLSISEDTVAQQPTNARAHYSVGLALLRRGRHDEAASRFHKALQVEPNYSEAYEAIALVYVHRGQVDAAIEHLQKALTIRPGNVSARNDLGNLLSEIGRSEGAIEQYGIALRYRPDGAELHYNLGNALIRSGRLDEATSHYLRAIQIQPDYAEAHDGLGTALFFGGRADEAIVQYQEALKINPDGRIARGHLNAVSAERDRVSKALSQKREMTRLRPNDVALLNDTAWILATDPNPSFRNGADAVGFAESALRLAGDRDPAVLDTLAAAYAEAGRFSEAIETADHARVLASNQRNTSLVEKITERLRLYRAHTAFRDQR